MATATSVSVKQINYITECPICREVFTDHRVLPCIHAFCLKCLMTYGEGKQPGEALACPVCRKEFNVPDEGLTALQRNFFIDRLLEVKKRCLAHENTDRTCDWCSGDQEESDQGTTPGKLATKYCIQCGLSYCGQCAKGHDRNPALRRHKLEDLGSAELDGDDLLTMLPSAMCDKHQNEIDVFCLDCNKAMCIKCYLKDHKTHAYSDIADEAERFRKQMDSDISQASDGMKICDKVMKKLDDGGKAFEEHIFDLEKVLCARAADMTRQIEAARQKLLDELTHMRHDRMKKIQTVRQEVEMHKVALDSFRRYCEEVKAKGTDSDATRAAGDLHGRAVELGSFDVLKHVTDSLAAIEVNFNASTVMPGGEQNAVNVVGSVEMKDVQGPVIVIDDPQPVQDAAAAAAAADVVADVAAAVDGGDVAPAQVPVQ